MFCSTPGSPSKRLLILQSLSVHSVCSSRDDILTVSWPISPPSACCFPVALRCMLISHTAALLSLPSSLRHLRSPKSSQHVWGHPSPSLSTWSTSSHLSLSSSLLCGNTGCCHHTVRNDENGDNSHALLQDAHYLPSMYTLSFHE